MDEIAIIFYAIFTIIGLFILLFIRKLMIEIKKLNKTNEQLLQTFKQNGHSLEEYKKVEKEQLKEELHSYIYVQALQVRDAVYKQTNDLFQQAIEDAPKSHGLTIKQLSTMFTNEQIESIEQFWFLFNNYLNKYWLTDQGTYKTVFPNKELQQIQQESKQLVKLLDQLLTKMK